MPSAPDDLQHALNHNQIACKTWLLDALYGALGGRFGTVALLGGWYGVLGALLLGDARFRVDRVVSFDIDPDCTRIARALNRDAVAEGRFAALTADVRELDYAGLNGGAKGGGARAAAERAAAERAAAERAAANGAPDLVINTSCEHIAPTSAWYERVPKGMLQAHQSNDYYDCPEHVNCLPDLDAFKADLPMRELLYQGTMARKKYTRFMLIGRK
jgi:hypothetical protein